MMSKRFLFVSKGSFSKAEGEESGEYRRAAALALVLSQLSALFMCIVLGMTLTSDDVHAVVWEPEIEISTDAGIESQYNPSMAIDGETVHVVWQENGPGRRDIYYRRFNGLEWEQDMEISVENASEHQRVPSVAADSGMVHVVWVEDAPGGWALFYRRFNGTSWEPETEICGNTVAFVQPAIAVDGERVHIAWADERDGDPDIYYIYFNGTNWQPEQQISTEIMPEMEVDPSIAVDGSEVHVVWKEGDIGDIAYRHFDGSAWQPELIISTDSMMEPQYYPSIAADAGNVHVVWADFEDGDQDIYYRHFDGIAWQPEVELSSDVSVEDEFKPTVSVYGDGIYVAWEGESVSGDLDIFYRQYDGSSWQPVEEISTDAKWTTQHSPSLAVNGYAIHAVWWSRISFDNDITYRRNDWIVWQPELELSVDDAPASQSNPTVAVDSNAVHAVWEDLRDLDSDIYYRFFDGSDWQLELEISSDIGTEAQNTPSIAADLGQVHVVWQDEREDEDIYYRHYDGISWMPEQDISEDGGTEGQKAPSMAVDGDRVHVVWLDWLDGDADVYYRYSDGVSWQPKMEISTDVGNENQYDPSIAVDGNEVHIVWQNDGGGDPDIYYRHFDGTVWQPEMEISTDVGSELQIRPAIAASGGKAHAVWQGEGDADYEIYYRLFDGMTWQPEIEISTDVAYEAQYKPSIASEGEEVHVVWEDGGDGDLDIYYRHFNGTDWEPELEISTDSGSEQQTTPSIAVYGGYVHLVWVDFEDGDGDIYYRRTIEEALPDYIPWDSTPSSPQLVMPGGSYPINAKVKNIGKRNATSTSTIAFYNETERDFPFQSYTVGSLDSSEISSNFQAVWNAPNSPGLHNVTIEVDYEYDILELNETNNTQTIQFIVPAIPPPANLSASVVNVTDIMLEWDPPDSLFLSHYLVYRETDQREFDFSNPIYNTSRDSQPLRTNWTDIDATGTSSPTEYYYVVRAVSSFGMNSITSNTAGKWTRSFREGRNAFSLPLEPFVDRKVSWYSENIPGTEFIRWMNTTGHWVTHYPSTGEGVNDIPAIMGDSYEISLSSEIDFTFCGYPASMIRFQEGLGDSILFRKSLSAQVEGSDTNLSWWAVAGVSRYLIFRSQERVGLHNLSMPPIASTTETYWADQGIIGNQRSEDYYMVIPEDSFGRLGSSTYSVGVFTVEYQSGSDSFALPLKPVQTHSLDWYSDNIPNVVGIIHLVKGYWRLHARDMPEGVYDAEVFQAEGLQVSIGGPTTTYTFIGY